MEPGGIFPTNPDLANILGDTDFDLYILLLSFESQISGFSVPQISNFPDFQVPRFSDAAGTVGAAGRILRSQSDPSPNAPRDQISRKGPCCDDLALQLYR